MKAIPDKERGDKGCVAIVQCIHPNAPHETNKKMLDHACWKLADQASYHNVDVSKSVVAGLDNYDELIAWAEKNLGSNEAYALGNGWAAFKEPSDIELVKAGGTIVGARITFACTIDGDHDYPTTYIYDAVANRITAQIEHGYEMRDEIELTGAVETLSGSATSVLREELEGYLENVTFNGKNWDVWGADFTGPLTKETFKDAAYIRHDKIEMRPLGGANDPVLVEAAKGLTASQKKELSTGIAKLREHLTDLHVIEVEGGSFGDFDATSVYLVGLDPDGQMIYARGARPN